MKVRAAGLVEERRNMVRQLKKVTAKKKCKGCRAERRRGAQTELQKLFLLCRDVFKGPGTVPLPEDVQKLSRVLDNLKPEDFGLSKDLPLFRPNCAADGIPRVTYTTIYSSENFSLTLFFLPTNGVIPLHNHPGMTVFGKLLLGTMHIKAYDWVDSDNANKSNNCAQSSQVKLARLKANEDFTWPCDTTVLYPTSGGNIHAFTAKTPCIVLDVMGPPYSKDDRDCTYYKDVPYAGFPNEEGVVGTEDGESYGWLEEIEMPTESKMDAMEYLGPQVFDNTNH